MTSSSAMDMLNDCDLDLEQTAPRVLSVTHADHVLSGKMFSTVSGRMCQWLHLCKKRKGMNTNTKSTRKSHLKPQGKVQTICLCQRGMFIHPQCQQSVLVNWLLFYCGFWHLRLGPYYAITSFPVLWSHFGHGYCDFKILKTGFWNSG